MLNDFHFSIHEQFVQFHFGEVLVLLTLRTVVLLPPDLDDTVLLKQGVGEPVVQNRPAIILTTQYVVYVVCGLLRRLHILRALRLKLYQFVA